MRSHRESMHILDSVFTRHGSRIAGVLVVLFLFPFGALASLVESSGNNPFTLSTPVSVGSYFDFALQIRNTGTATVNLTSFGTTGPFTLQSNTCGSALAPGATCSGNIGVRFAPTTVGPASGSLIVGNDSGDGPFTLGILAAGTDLVAPTVTASFSPTQIYSGTGVSTLALTLANPNVTSLHILNLNLNLPAGFSTTANPDPASSCGGMWNGLGTQPPGNSTAAHFTGMGAEIPGNGSCVISLDVMSANPPGNYSFSAERLRTFEVWGAIPTGSTPIAIIAPTAGAPGAPTNVAATGGNAQATATFSPPANPGTSSIVGYTVTSRPQGGSDNNAGSTGLSHAITGLANGTAYTFSVTASNNTGAGVPSAASNAVTPSTIPGVPTNVIATRGNGQAVVTFAPPVSDGGIPITGYAAVSNPPGGFDANSGSTGFSHSITGLANGTPYTFAVIASNALGTGGPSAPSNTITPGPATAHPLPDVIHQIPQNRSQIPTQTWPIEAGPIPLNAFEPAYQIPRAIEFADFNGDGYLDIVLAPAFPLHAPPLPLAIWLNNGDGTFHDGTAEVIESAPPLTWNGQLLIGDFNHDGRPDVFMFSTGADRNDHPELPCCTDPGYYSRLLLSQANGKYIDASDKIPANAPASYTHQGGIGDANGDATPDVVTTVIANTGTDIGGTKLLLGDGSGGFIDATNSLPSSVRLMSYLDRLTIYDFGYQQAGSSGLVDLDGDGKAEVITASGGGAYDTAPDGTPIATRTVRFHKLGADGKYFERGRVAIPAAVAAFEAGYGETNVPGCAQIIGGDLTGSGRNDLVLYWEGLGRPYIEILRNDGNFQFTDITLEAMGSYETNFLILNGPTGPGHFRLMDINGDGTLDIVYKIGSLPVDSILPHVAFLNDGAGHFTPWVPQVASGPLISGALSVAQCTHNCLPLVFDTNKSGVASLVLMDFESSVSSSLPSQTTTVYLTDFPAVPAVSLSVTVAGSGTGSVTSDQPGIACPADCFERYPSGTGLTLTASPNVGSAFVGWLGACTGTAITCQLPMSGNTGVTAVFLLPVVLMPTSVPDGTVGTAYAVQNLGASGGTTTYTFAVTSGALPDGLTLTSAGVLSGTPNAAGTFNFTVTATDSTPVGLGGPFTGGQAYAIAVGKGGANATVTSDFNPSALGQAVIFTVIVSDPGSTPTGTVTFFDGATPLCLAVSLVAGQATCVYSNLPIGSHSITAAYSGDGNYVPATSPSYQQTVSGISLTVSKGGSGSGTVTSDSPGISCGIDCTETYASATPVTLTATPATGSVFTGWLGPCTGAGTCNVNVNSTINVSATFAPNTVLPRVDVDGATGYDALTDGLLIFRYLSGLTGTALTSGAIGAGPSLPTPADVLQHLDNIRPLLDVDGNGQVDAATDGLLIMRYLFGLRGAALTNGAIGAGATRNGPQIETYIQSLMP